MWRTIQTAPQANLTSEGLEKKEAAEKKKQPGFELAFGIIGLVVVSYVSRKRRA